jgi:predicted DNA-binding transcriptional regulator
MADTVDAALLVVVVSGALKIHVQSVVFVEIVELAWIGVALYYTLKPNTKLEKVKDTKQPNFILI